MKLHLTRVAAFASLAVAALVTAGAATPAPSATVFATGFNNPRGLTFGPNGNLYVAEGGLGGTNVEGTCPEGDVQGAAFPYSGSVGDPVNGGRISMISPDGTVSTVVSGLPTTKTAPTLGSFVTGVSSIAFIGHRLYALLAGAGCAHGNPSAPTSIIRVHRGGTWTQVANLNAFQFANPVLTPDPEDFDPDGTWFSMAAADGSLYPMDSNHGELDRVNPRTGQVTRVIDISAQVGHVVPTALVQHGVWYIANLGLFPDDGATAGDESVYQLTPSGHFRVYATGLEKVLALAMDGGKLYALEMSTTPGKPTPGNGQIVRVKPGGAPEVVYSGLIFPTGMAIGPDGSFYVTDHGFGFGAGAGRVLKITVGR